MYHLKLKEVCLVTDYYLNTPTPYSDTMAVLNEKFGEPHHVALKKIASVMDSPDVRCGDTAAFNKFTIQVQFLARMLWTLGPYGNIELMCESHVECLFSKLPPVTSTVTCFFTRQVTHRPYSSSQSGYSMIHGVKTTMASHQTKGIRTGLGRSQKSAHRKHGTSILHGAKDNPECGAAASAFNSLAAGKKKGKAIVSLLQQP